jgi:hypothetical protein
MPMVSDVFGSECEGDVRFKTAIFRSCQHFTHILHSFPLFCRLYVQNGVRQTPEVGPSVPVGGSAAGSAPYASSAASRCAIKAQ